jgi:hypothetical protein
MLKNTQVLTAELKCGLTDKIPVILTFDLVASESEGVCLVLYKTCRQSVNIEG